MPPEGCDASGVLLPGWEFRLDVEAGAGFGGVFVVTVDGGFGVLPEQGGYEAAEGLPLSIGAGISRSGAVGFDTTYIYYTYRSGILSGTMRTDAFYRPARVDGAVEVYHIVVADAVPAVGAVPAVDVGDGDLTATGCGGAMEDEF